MTETAIDLRNKEILWHAYSADESSSHISKISFLTRSEMDMFRAAATSVLNKDIEWTNRSYGGDAPRMGNGSGSWAWGFGFESPKVFVGEVKVESEDIKKLRKFCKETLWENDIKPPVKMILESNKIFETAPGYISNRELPTFTMGDLKDKFNDKLLKHFKEELKKLKINIASFNDLGSISDPLTRNNTPWQELEGPKACFVTSRDKTFTIVLDFSAKQTISEKVAGKSKV